MTPTPLPEPHSELEAAIEARRAAEAELARERRFMNALLESTGTAIVACDENGTLALFNRASRRLHGLPDEPLPPERWAERYHLFEADGWTPMETESIPLVRAFNGESVRNVEMVIAPLDRTPRTVLASGEPMLDATGRRLGAVVSMHDVTEQKAAEREREELLYEVRRVGEVSRALASATSAAAVADLTGEAALDLVHARMASLWVPTADRRALVVASSAGVDVSGFRIELDGPDSSGAKAAFLDAEPLFIHDARHDPRVSPAYVEATQVKGCLFEPLSVGAEVLGVLVVGWAESLQAVPEQARPLLTILARDAAAALERDRRMARLREKARTDALTGLPNRGVWDEELPRALARARRTKEPLSVALLDLDRFKAYNDRFGHTAGDRLLRAAAAEWSGPIRETDLLVRYGGEEFALVLPDCDIEHAAALLRRLQPLTPGAQTFSAGVATWDGEELPELLLGRADAALYEAKRAGRNRVMCAGEDTGAERRLR